MKKNKMDTQEYQFIKETVKKQPKENGSLLRRLAYDSRMWRFVWRLRSRNLCQCVSGYGG